MKIGIYLVYRPFKKDASFKKEGLGRYLAMLVKSLLQNDNQVVIACPKWSVDILTELFEDHKLNFDAMELVCTDKNPILLEWYYKRKEKKEKSSWKGKFAEISYGFIDKMFDNIVSVQNVFAFWLMNILMLLAGIFLLPFFGIMFVAYIIFRIIRVIFRIVFKIDIKTVAFSELLVRVTELPGLQFVRKRLVQLATSDNITEIMRLKAASELKYKIEHMSQPADIWYSPSAFWPEFNKIRVLSAVNVPDFVSEEFAVGFSEHLEVATAIKIISKTIETGKYFITYGNHVKKTVLENKFGIQSENIISIMMFTNDASESINVQKTFKYHSNANLRFARQLLTTARAYNENSINPLFFASDMYFSLENIKYIFYSSQIRSSKNVLNLIKAYELLLRKELITCKLFLTGSYSGVEIIREYIKVHNLQNDVLSFYNVPNNILSSLYACAELSVNPTLYEGGFPFTFSEGLSVGTPSVMSNIPQVVEILGSPELEVCLFNPYDYVDMADKILYGLQHRNELLELQLPIFNAHLKRTQDGSAGREYMTAFKQIIELNENCV